MSRFLFQSTLFSVLLMMLFSIAGAVQADEVLALLKKADNFRLSSDSSQVEVKIDLYKNEILNKERRYSVFIKPDHRSLVLFLHASERGQKVLMLDDKFWTILPNSKRPIRITATQKLLGEASSGDIATMTWSDDYRGKLLGEENVLGLDCLHLDLTAIRQGVSYQRIELFLEKARGYPVQAKLYLASGKVAKIAEFEMGKLNGDAQVVKMTLRDRIRKNRKTVVHYLSVSDKSIPDKYYNPAYLVRNPNDTL